MSMNKIKNIPLETTATYQALSNLNVQFSNQDTQTAILQFQITRNNYPLALSEENVEVFIALESGDSFLVDKNLDFTDQLNGIVSYTIPDDFMRVAKDVVGQVYVTTLDGEETIVQRQFSFVVANDLIANLPAEDKIREIKYFSDMRAEVAQIMDKLNNDFENMNDYVSQVNQATDDGIDALTKLIDSKQKAYNDNHTAKMKELNDKGKEYSTKFDSDKQYIDDAQAKFVQSVNGSGVVTTGVSKDWQKYKILPDNGNTGITNLNNDIELLHNLKPGYYYTTNTPGILTGGFSVTTSAGFLLVLYRDSGLKHLVFRPYNSNQQFLKRYYNIWNDWEVLGVDFSKFETTQGATEKANTAEINSKAYIDTKYNSRHATLFEGTANGVGTSIALSETLDNFIVVYVYGQTPGGYFVETADPQGVTDFVFEKTNVIGVDGNEATVFECVITKTNRTSMKIISDTYHGVKSGNGSGHDANRFTITKIVGVRK
ncbi:BppU family phage baseplate upper protein [Staphylococcus saprophyticus]|nr:BppU family phage baseplate upper protein [Staphylococcus saprophyticus]